MSDKRFQRKLRYEEGSMFEDVEFLNNLRARQIEMSERARRKIGGKIKALTRAIARAQRDSGENEGRVRCKGHNYYFEVICTKLTAVRDPFAPLAPDNFLRTVSVCTKKEFFRNNPFV